MTTKVSYITYIACLVKRPRKLNDEFNEIFDVELKDYWRKLLGFQVDKFEAEVCPLSEVKDPSRYGDRAYDIINLLLLNDLEIDKTIQDDVTWE
jgi:hypothetical protein